MLTLWVNIRDALAQECEGGIPHLGQTKYEIIDLCSLRTDWLLKTSLPARKKLKKPQLQGVISHFAWS